MICVCGNPDGSNDECERCRLIAKIAELEAANRELEITDQGLAGTIEALQARIAELEHKSAEDKGMIHMLNELRKASDARMLEEIATNARLRELLREALPVLRVRAAFIAAKITNELAEGGR